MGMYYRFKHFTKSATFYLPVFSTGWRFPALLLYVYSPLTFTSGSWNPNLLHGLLVLNVFCLSNSWKDEIILFRVSMAGLDTKIWPLFVCFKQDYIFVILVLGTIQHWHNVLLLRQKTSGCTITGFMAQIGFVRCLTSCYYKISILHCSVHMNGGPLLFSLILVPLPFSHPVLLWKGLVGIL